MVISKVRLWGRFCLASLGKQGKNPSLLRKLAMGDSPQPDRPALNISGDANIVKCNVVVGEVSGIGLASESKRNSFRNNIVSINDRALSGVGIDGGDSACSNTWKENEFITESEGDGANEGCI